MFPFVLGSLLQRIGFAWTVRVWAAATLVAFSGSILTLRPRRPVLSQRAAKYPPIDLSWFKSPVVIVMVRLQFGKGERREPPLTCRTVVVRGRLCDRTGLLPSGHLPSHLHFISRVTHQDYDRPCYPQRLEYGWIADRRMV